MTPEVVVHHPSRGSTHLHRVMTGTKRVVAEEVGAHTIGAAILVVAPTTLLEVGMISLAVAIQTGMQEAAIVIREEGEEKSQQAEEAPWTEDRHMRTATGTTNLGLQETTTGWIPIVGLSTRGRDMRTRTGQRTEKEGTTEIEAPTLVNNNHSQGP